MSQKADKVVSLETREPLTPTEEARTPAERKVVAAHKKHAADSVEVPEFKAVDGENRIEVAADDMELAKARITQAFGGISERLQGHLLDQMVQTVSVKSRQIDHVDRLMMTMDAIGPKDPTEAILVAQMVASHETAMTCIKRSAIIDQGPEYRELNFRYAAKFQRIFIEQMQALTKYRNGGRQTVTVVRKEPRKRRQIQAVEASGGGNG